MRQGEAGKWTRPPSNRRPRSFGREGRACGCTLYDGAADGEHVLVLHVLQKGLQVYSFTFG